MDEYLEMWGANDAPPDTSGVPSSSVPGDSSGGLTAKDGLNAFNNLLNVWLKHDSMQMQRNQPNAYGQYGMVRQGVLTPQQQQNRSNLLLIGLVVVAVMIAKD